MFNQCEPEAAIEQFAGDAYIQHNPHVADGKAAFIAYFEEMARDYPGKKVHFKKVLADFPHYSFTEQTKFLNLLNKEGLDLMHFTHFNAPIFYNKPFIVTIHDLTLSFFPGDLLFIFIRWQIAN